MTKEGSSTQAMVTFTSTKHSKKYTVYILVGMEQAAKNYKDKKDRSVPWEQIVAPEKVFVGNNRHPDSTANKQEISELLFHRNDPKEGDQSGEDPKEAIKSCDDPKEAIQFILEHGTMKEEKAQGHTAIKNPANANGAGHSAN